MEEKRKLKKIIITGCNGQLGRAVNIELGMQNEYELINTDVAEGEGIHPLDITSIDAVTEFTAEVKALNDKYKEMNQGVDTSK